MKEKVMVGMSGGVDSSVAAKLLLDSGYDVTGVTLKLFSDDDIISDDKTRTCCSLSDVEDARAVAYRLGFEHLVFNFKEKFRECVMEHFVKSYLEGKTPNPCIECNRHIKFDKMLERAKTLGFNYIATGHYAQKRFDEKSGRYLLIRPRDSSKDQTYVLYNMTQTQLEKTLFPLGELNKTEVRAIAEASGLVNSRKPDSQDICFVPDGDYAGFIRAATDKPIPEGDFTDLDGNILGRHSGIINYTVGQRKGLGVSFGKPVFVISKDVTSNRVILGESDDLFSDTLIADNINLISVAEITSPMKVTAKARYSQKETPAVIYPYGSDRLKVVFDSPQRALCEGQAVVFYNDDIVVGGATICEVPQQK